MSDDTRREIEVLYRTQGGRLWRAVRAFAGDGDVADDAVAEAFAQALRRGSEVRSPVRWIWKTAFRIAAAELQRRRKSASIDGMDAVYEDDLDGHESLLAALRRLSPKQRGAVVLHDYAGFQIAETARILDSTQPAVRVHLSRGRKRLRALLKEDMDE